ncbi:MAG: TetR family transcriptional regulator [Methylobacteriaceae bacterium]|nr:TetR family transcriptional regulator [Methylobacteriaceae bacterium]
MRPRTGARSRDCFCASSTKVWNLLREVDFDGLSIETLCARSDATVGAFYSRFENKEAFVGALQRLVVAKTRRGVMADYEGGASPADDLGASHGLDRQRARLFGIGGTRVSVRASLRRANGERDVDADARIGRAADFLCPAPHPAIRAACCRGVEQRVRTLRSRCCSARSITWCSSIRAPIRRGSRDGAHARGGDDAVHSRRPSRRRRWPRPITEKARSAAKSLTGLSALPGMICNAVHRRPSSVKVATSPKTST